jgi:hypothetical protein
VAAAHGVRPSAGAFEAALAVLAAVSVLGVFFASRLAQRQPRAQGQSALPASE